MCNPPLFLAHLPPGIHLQELPAEGLSQLSGTLVVLLLGGNKLQHLPEEVGRLSCLEALAVDDNQLGELPASLGKTCL